MFGNTRMPTAFSPSARAAGELLIQRAQRRPASSSSLSAPAGRTRAELMSTVTAEIRMSANQSPLCASACLSSSSVDSCVTPGDRRWALCHARPTRRGHRPGAPDPVGCPVRGSVDLHSAPDVVARCNILCLTQHPSEAHEAAMSRGWPRRKRQMPRRGVKSLALFACA
jgi:hypothetical protein